MSLKIKLTKLSISIILCFLIISNFYIWKSPILSGKDMGIFHDLGFINFILMGILCILLFILIGSREMFIKKHYIHQGNSRQMSNKQQNSDQSQSDIKSCSTNRKK